jgi:protein-tyrosine-phosphatase
MTFSTREELSVEQQLQIQQAAERLQREFAGLLNTETIERFMNDSLELLLPRAHTTMWVPLLTERFARDRLRALVRLEKADPGVNPSVLFLCVHNAGRSQMAAGFMRALSGGQVEVFSGGSEPAEEINRAAVEAMAEAGIDITEEFPKPWTDEIVRAADVIVTMGCGDACPVYPGKRYVDWELPDPAGRPLEEVRQIRDEIEQRVRQLMAELGVSAVR